MGSAQEASAEGLAATTLPEGNMECCWHAGDFQAYPGTTASPYHTRHSLARDHSPSPTKTLNFTTAVSPIALEFTPIAKILQTQHLRGKIARAHERIPAHHRPRHDNSRHRNPTELPEAPKLRAPLPHSTGARHDGSCGSRGAIACNRHESLHRFACNPT
jgi:hypothetical protein